MFFCLDTKEPKNQGCISFLKLCKPQNPKLKKLAIGGRLFSMGLGCGAVGVCSSYSSAHTVYSF